MEYEVKKGDGWYRIAKNLGVNVNELLKANNATLDTMLHPGQMLQTSKAEEQPVTLGSWETVAGQNSAVTNWAQSRIDAINQTRAQKEAEEQEIQRKASIGTKGLVQQQIKADTIRLQQALLKEGYDLGRWGVDGNWGNATNAAIKAAEKDGWVVDGYRLVKKQPTIQRNASMAGANNPVTNPGKYSMRGAINSSTTQPRVSGINTTSNNPMITALEDFIIGATNKAYRAITKNKDYLVKNRDIYDVPEDQKQVMREYYMAKQKRYGKAPTGWQASDYHNLQGYYTGGSDKRSMWSRIFTPEGAIEHSLGQFRYQIDPDTGDVYMIDTYDWNSGEGSPGQGFYTTARNIMGEYGTKDSDPKGQARQYRVNLGNPKDWKNLKDLQWIK